MSLVELVGEHAHHDEVVVPAGEENMFPQLLRSSIRPPQTRRLAAVPRTPVLHQGTPLSSVVDVNVGCQAFVSRAIGLAGIGAAVTLIL
ncbi:hypothetical protein ACWEP4_28045 [Streptomyces sp. NPDC004227]